MEAVETFKHGDIEVRIYQDPDPENPEGMTDAPVWLGHYHRQFHRDPKELPFRDGPGFVDWYARYTADERAREDEVSVSEMLSRAAEMQEQWAVFIVRAYIHGGVSLALEGGLDHARMPDQQWDVSRCGVVLIDKKAWKNAYLDTREENAPIDWRAIAEAHVKEWNQYLSGDVYGFKLFDADGEVIEDSALWGIYGIENVREEAVAAAEAHSAFEAKLVAELEELDLDELVHDVKSQEASDINNEGPESQVRFLLKNGFTAEELRRRLKEAE